MADGLLVQLNGKGLYTQGYTDNFPLLLMKISK